jgi:hypothetical protein
MESSSEAVITCGELGRAAGEANSLHRFILGVDPQPVRLDQAEIEALDDPFANLLLANGVFPTTAEQVLTEFDSAVPGGDPLATQRSFVVGEGSQLAPGAPLAGVRAFLLTRGDGPDGPDVFISTGGPADEFIEVMAWDRTAKGFNYYQTRQAASPWVLAGNSADALRTGSARNGPFESHPSGSILMKELRFPWVHWHSFAAVVRPDVAGDQLANHPWFAERSGAQELETAAVMPAIRRWTTTRLDAAVDAAGNVASPRLIIESFLKTPTVNLVSSRVEANLIIGGAEESFDIPHAFFVDSECLVEILGLPAPDPAQFTASSAEYLQVLTDHKVTLRLDDGAAVGAPPQDTHFAFVVPERAFEDIETVRGAVEIGLVTRRLAAALLMVDFANPVFSSRREQLLAHVPGTAMIADGASTFSDEFADAIRKSSAAGEEDGSPEHEFAQLWDAGEDGWPNQFSALLTDYYDRVAAKLREQGGLDEIFRLAESRRDRVRDMPIHENPLLFATPDPRIGESLRMQPGGEIVTA